MRATWDQIVSAGHLDLLPKKAVEFGLSQNYAVNHTLNMREQNLKSDYRNIVRKIIPLGMQIDMRATCSDVRDHWCNIVGFAKHCTFHTGPASLKKVAEELHDNPAVVANLRLQYTSAVAAVLDLNDDRKPWQAPSPHSAPGQLKSANAEQTGSSLGT